ncbi:MAG: ATP-binding protein, partial [Planctomycetes bacterium]|nr:ATP-binding protein [Planctomycetota bacterium]
MAYRSIKRVVGETGLERKCRFLFVACLSVLLFGSFWWVEHIAEELVKDTAIRKARDLVDASLLRQHWEGWESEEGPRELALELSRDLGTQRYDWAILALDETPSIDLGTSVQLPASEEEAQILRKLKNRFQKQMADRAHRSEDEPALVMEPTVEDPQGDIASPPSDTKTAIELQPVYEFRPVPKAKRIHYYQPVYWKNSCLRCHKNFEGIDAFARADATLLLDKGSYPFRVVRVIFSERETQEATTWSRALLTAIGIFTVFVAMVILYVIIRYVVVRPLQHLRDVSEEISRGNTELRAEIQTNDEFEELANAFNRMLRHLTDAQAELRQVNADLDAKVDQLAQLNMRLYEMNRLKSDFLANMSHELRTPLNSIIGFSEVLQGIDTLNDKQKRYAQNIQKSGRSLLDMINDILDLAKIEAGKMELRLTEFRIGALVNAQCDMVRSLSEEKNIDLAVEIQPELPVMFQDQSKIQQILLNLLSNAIKFTPEGGRISVRVGRGPDGRLQLSIADTGVGIAEEDRDIIFEKFRQSSNSMGDGNLTREYTGTGLGLSIVKELCKLLGGEITFQSELGRGSTFTVILPWSLPLRPRHGSDI